MKKNSSFPVLMFVVTLGIGAALAYAMHRVSADIRPYGFWGAPLSLPSSFPQQFRLRINGARRLCCGSASSAPFRDQDCL